MFLVCTRYRVSILQIPARVRLGRAIPIKCAISKSRFSTICHGRHDHAVGAAKDAKSNKPVSFPSGRQPRAFVEGRSNSITHIRRIYDASFRQQSPKEWVTRRVKVPVGGNGHVSLDLRILKHTEEDGEKNVSRARDILVYLPPGPPLDVRQAQTSASVEQDHNRQYRALLDHLSVRKDSAYSALNRRGISTIAKVNYRLSPSLNSKSSDSDHRYPLPVHDVSVVFDWIIDNLISEPARAGKTAKEPEDDDDIGSLEPEPRLLLVGSHFGGSLALTLALTQPNDISAVAVYDPITDWVGLDELAAPIAPTISLVSNNVKRRSKLENGGIREKIQAAANHLIKLRTRLFRNPSAFFDPFASPLLFLRAPGRDTPLWRTARPEEDFDEESDDFIDDDVVLEAMKKDGGVEINAVEMRETISERGYGPYDDDWHTAEHSNDDMRMSRSPNSERITTDLAALSLGNDVRGHLNHKDLYRHDQNQVLSDLSLPFAQTTAESFADSSLTSSISPFMPSQRRRKVLRRWPSVGRPEDVELPDTIIYSSTLPQPTPPSLESGTEFECIESEPDVRYILHPQAKEMADVMRRACFWGRDPYYAAEKVVFEAVEAKTAVSMDGDFGGSGEQKVAIDSGDIQILKQAVDWLMR